MDKEYGMGCGFLLPAALEIMRAGLIYYSRDGEPVLCLGESVPGEYMKLPKQVAYELRKTGAPYSRVTDGEDGSYVVTYGIARDSGGNMQGYIMTRQPADTRSPGTRGDGDSDGAPAGARRTAITPGTGMSELFAAYPALWNDIGRLDEELSGLDDPMAIEMLRQATVGELAKSLGAERDGLIAKINELISGYVGAKASSKG
jgi:hypothetical protein